MAKPIQQKSKYNISHAEMIESAKTKRGFFLEDKAGFVAFDADFDDPYAADWLTAITAAEAVPTDETIDDQLTQLTADVETEMKKCRNKFQDTKYFIEKAFPNNQPVWNEFGYNNYNDARRVQVKMLQFMKTFHTVCEKYKVKLDAAGYPQAKIDEIPPLRTLLDAANTAQEVFIGNLPVQTQERISKHNIVWDIEVRVCTAGKNIFQDDYAKYQRYLLPPGEESPEALSITGLVSDQANGNALEGALLVLQPVAIETESGADGRYSFGGLPDGDYTLAVSLTDYVSQHIPITITGGNAVEVNVQLVHV
ncbi:MAG: carboxypeptidase regulatory-like domain-containing protein [Bacteroidia bacterium]